MSKLDPQLNDLCNIELQRQQDSLNLIASENYVSREVRMLLGSVFTNKYFEGYPGRRYYPGNIHYDAIERLAQERALQLFGLKTEEWGVNVQPLSGAPANLAVYAALLTPGDTIMGMSLPSGGHLSHGHSVSFSGKLWKSIHYTVSSDTNLIDYDAVRALAQRERPKLIVCGFTAYPRIVDFEAFSCIAKEVGAYLMADISHIAGLVALGLHPSPFAVADIVTTTAHKTLRGPRGALIFAKRDARDLPSKIDKSVFPGMQGGPHGNVIAAMAQAFYEALQPDFENYQRQIVHNVKAMAIALTERGFTLLTGGTDTHLILVDMRPLNLDGRTAEKILEAASILANRNSLPDDTKPLLPSGIRLGTPAVTTRGMQETDMNVIAEFLLRLLVRREDSKKVFPEVVDFIHRFPLEIQ